MLFGSELVQHRLSVSPGWLIQEGFYLQHNLDKKDKATLLKPETLVYLVKCLSKNGTNEKKCPLNINHDAVSCHFYNSGFMLLEHKSTASLLVKSRQC